MNLRSPIGVARGLGSAREGVHHWWMQRLTAIALVPLLIWMVASLIALTGADRDAIEAWLSSPVPAVLTILLIGATFYHAALGLQVVIEDYVHAEAVKVTLVVLNYFVAIVLGLLAVVSVLRLAFA